MSASNDDDSVDEEERERETVAAEGDRRLEGARENGRERMLGWGKDAGVPNLP